ncbi:bifunctional 3-(3-hydroxy-phenyl)propionate/3-hydroxycinnamic acid hydroxylase [Sphingomonas sp. LaA6.9]|uniref:bifunctional 3-(3-hydroxy-phenyl)propionate/3-hydroxycinnamic acid hydroxylase n=1 Tax=Sphingomonas sp. LaA6.9 TaxID=2919914 RepID=UPI001F500DAD|nr:bifunctional 3-(3-hydroxy-phenyl)propionate/3-hydroxycinnamic acid hydroxylase [Sphingomonas sp. LaA6.9]MCJ8158295.1 bifunctional 3-(3-hydroxy-phenyl)propionate/3-hydroxycinnamic acid hydroxylase [Sphingomonas sp. LaA6.9]
MMRNVLECDVVIVGGGPVGVTLAVLLAQRGVSVIVAEKAPEIHPLPRAAHIDHEGMRVLQEAGVAQQAMRTSRRGDRYDFINAKGDVLLSFEAGERIAPGGWPSGNMIHQPSIEAHLREALAKRDPSALRSQWEATGFQDTETGVVVQVATPEGNREVHARYLVGADGARSTVRRAHDIEFDDLGFEEQWLVVDAIVHDFDRMPKFIMQVCDPVRPTTCSLMGEGRHRWEFMIKPGETAEELSEDESIAGLLEPWKVDGAVSLERKAVYTFRARIAREWRKGHVLLIGDAAHQTPPFAGQGLCSGLRDAANLAWKLTAIVRDGAPDSVLDTYQPEREPNVRATIEMAIMMGRTVCITDPVAAAERDRQMIAARAAGQSPDGSFNFPPIDRGLILAGAPGAGQYFAQPCAGESGSLKLDDVLGAGAWLITRTPAAPVDGLVTVTLDDPRVAAFRDALERELAIHKAEAVLVRPDRYIFGTGNAGELSKAWSALLTPQARVAA